MESTIIEDINQYIAWFNERLSFLSEIKDDELQILACCSLLDALAKCVYYDKRNKERFISLLEKFGDNIWSKVSIIHLLEDSDFNYFIKQQIDIKKYFEELNWQTQVERGRIFNYEMDPLYEV